MRIDEYLYRQGRLVPDWIAPMGADGLYQCQFDVRGYDEPKDIIDVLRALPLIKVIRHNTSRDIYFVDIKYGVQ